MHRLGLPLPKIAFQNVGKYEKLILTSSTSGCNDAELSIAAVDLGAMIHGAGLAHRPLSAA